MGRIATASAPETVSLILAMSLENLLRINVENPLAGFQTRSSLLGLRPTVEVKFADPVEPTLKPLEISAVFLRFNTNELVDGPLFGDLGLEIRTSSINPRYCSSWSALNRARTLSS
jgi:hypothetical protein